MLALNLEITEREKLERAGLTDSDDGTPWFLAQTVRPRKRTAKRTPTLLPGLLDRIPAGRPARQGNGLPEGPLFIQSPQPPIPTPTSERQQVLHHALAVLQSGEPLLARHIASRIALLVPGVDRHLVNSVLSREGRPCVIHDDVTGHYRLGTQPGLGL